jgi:hypothetical protein
MEWVWHCDDDGLTRAHPGEDLPVQIRVVPVRELGESGVGAERLARESLSKSLVCL